MIVSVAHYQNQKDGRDYEEALQKLLNKGHQMSWFDDFLENHEDVPHVLVRYEDLHRDAAGMVKKIGQDVGLAVGEGKAKKAVDSHTFKNHHKKDPVMFRKGKVGGWSDYLTEEQANRVISIYRPFIDVVYPEGLPHV
jgi:hypothetical protein